MKALLNDKAPYPSVLLLITFFFSFSERSEVLQTQQVLMSLFYR